MEGATTALWTFHQRLGVFLTILAASLTLVATVSVLAYAGFRSAKRCLDIWRGKAPLVRPSDAVDSALFINLMVMDLLEGLGVFPNIKWMNDAMITAGPLCKCQGVMKNISGVGIATASLAIAVHGFSIIVLDWKPRRHATTMIIAAVWIFVTLIVIIPIGLVRHGLYGPVGYWCWITSEHKWMQIFNHYFWLWLDGILMAILYSIMFAVVRGWLMIDNGRLRLHKNYQPPEHGREEESDEDREIKDIAKTMLYYPAVYIAVALPYSIARWLYFSGRDPPYQFTLFANTLYTLSGVCDVALFLATRPRMIKHEVVDGTTKNHTDSTQMTPTTHTMNSGNHGHLPVRHHDLNPGSLPEGTEQYLFGKLGERDPEAPPTEPTQGRMFQVEYGRSSGRQRDNPTSSPLPEHALYEDPSERRQDLSSHSSSGQLGPETGIYGRLAPSGGFVPRVSQGRLRAAASASTVVREGGEGLGYLPR